MKNHLQIQCDDYRFLLASDLVLEVLVASGTDAVRWREQTLPIFDLNAKLHPQGSVSQHQLVLARPDTDGLRHVAVSVGQVLGTVDIDEAHLRPLLPIASGLSQLVDCVLSDGDARWLRLREDYFFQ